MRRAVPFVVVLVMLCAVPGFAVGPTLPKIPKYTSCEARGNVTSIFNNAPTAFPSCPSGYEERTVKIFVSLDIGSVAVVLSEALSDPEYASCIVARGLLVSPCYGDGQPICLITSWDPDGTCEN